MLLLHFQYFYIVAVVVVVVVAAANAVFPFALFVLFDWATVEVLVVTLVAFDDDGDDYVADDCDDDDSVTRIRMVDDDSLVAVAVMVTVVTVAAVGVVGLVGCVVFVDAVYLQHLRMIQSYEIDHFGQFYLLIIFDSFLLDLLDDCLLARLLVAVYYYDFLYVLFCDAPFRTGNPYYDI